VLTERLLAFAFAFACLDSPWPTNIPGSRTFVTTNHHLQPARLHLLDVQPAQSEGLAQRLYVKYLFG
jgi:hypothetical protein